MVISRLHGLNGGPSLQVSKTSYVKALQASMTKMKQE